MRMSALDLAAANVFLLRDRLQVGRIDASTIAANGVVKFHSCRHRSDQLLVKPAVRPSRSPVDFDAAVAAPVTAMQPHPTAGCLINAISVTEHSRGSFSAHQDASTWPTAYTVDADSRAAINARVGLVNAGVGDSLSAKLPAMPSGAGIATHTAIGNRRVAVQTVSSVTIGTHFLNLLSRFGGAMPEDVSASLGLSLPILPYLGRRVAPSA